MTEPNQLPAHDQLADDLDELGWDWELHGRMVDAAAPDDAVLTVAYDPSADPFLTGG